MTSKTIQLGLTPDSNSQWIAGVLYTQAITRALATLPDAKRPCTQLFIRRKFDGPHYDTLRQLTASSHHYDFITPLTGYRHYKNRLRQFLKSQAAKYSLKECLRQTTTNLLFPCRESLGPKYIQPWIGWIPDFQHKHLPELFDTQEQQKRDQQFQQLIDDSNHLVVSSRDAYEDLFRFYTAPKDKVSVYSFRTYSTPSWFEGAPVETANKYALPPKFLMFPSQFWQHKNHLTLLKAILAIKENGNPNICLVLTGKDCDYRNPDYPKQLIKFIDDHGLQEQVRYLGLLPRQEQIHLMRRAAAIVQPSHFEGWSMLVEDCRCLGKVMFLSDLNVHREQAYAKTHYFNRHSPDSLAELISAHWPTLEPGPDLADEAEAQAENQRLTRESGEQLLAIFQKTLSTTQPS